MNNAFPFHLWKKAKLQPSLTKELAVRLQENHFYLNLPQDRIPWKPPVFHQFPFIQHVFPVLLLCARCKAGHSSLPTTNSQIRGFPCIPNRCSVSAENPGPDSLLDLNSEVMVVQHFLGYFLESGSSTLYPERWAGMQQPSLITGLGIIHLPCHDTLSFQVRLSLENTLLLMNSPCKWNEGKWPWREALLAVITMRRK